MTLLEITRLLCRARARMCVGASRIIITRGVPRRAVTVVAAITRILLAVAAALTFPIATLVIIVVALTQAPQRPPDAGEQVSVIFAAAAAALIFVSLRHGLD